MSFLQTTQSRVWLFVLVLFFSILIVYKDLIVYGLGQGRGQLKILTGAVPLEEYLSQADLPDSLRNKALLIDDIKKFAFDQLAINPSENYSTIYDQKGKPSLWVVTAAPEFQLTSKEWRFPVIGKFSYKGFFELDKAKALKAELDSAGWDTGIRTVSAWSTLGWFQDPLMSNMLKRSEGDLANTIIHELTHGTVFVKDSLRFNENLASFIGDQGAQLFLVEKFGSEAEELISYQQKNEDQARFTDYILLATNQLDTLYKSWPPEMDVDEKRVKKAELLDQIKINIDTVDFHTTRYPKYFKKRSINNTFFLSYKRYRSKQVDFKESLEQEFGGDLVSFLNFYKKNYPSL